MIEYKTLKRGYAVFNDRRRVGTIQFVGGKGYTYSPIGSSHICGEFFPTLELCKQSLEAQ